MQSPPKLMELRPNRSLLNSDFDGYKLSLAEIPTITEELKVPVDSLKPDINQYSLLHAKLYALHNHLIGCNETDSVYFIDKELNVQKYFIESSGNTFNKKILWKVPLQRDRCSGDYNVSLRFASEKIAIIADGMGSLYVLDRGCSDDKWQLVFSGDVTGLDQKFIITDAVYKEAQKPQLHLLLTSLRQKESERNSTVLHWITLEKIESWNQTALRELTVDGFVQYANLERSCDAVYVTSDTSCKFTLDSENEVKNTPLNDSVEVQKKYKWSQSRNDISLQIPLPENFQKEQLIIKTQATQIQIKYENETFLEGALYQIIVPDLTCWSTENNSLNITLQKCEGGLMWPEIVKGNSLGEYVPDPGLVEEIKERLAPLTSDTEMGPPTGTTFNSQQVEECDFECDKLTLFERLSRDSHVVTHKINLGSHQILLNVNLETFGALGLGVRSDVDVCVWQPKTEGENFHLEHRGTLLALGYIQASKQQMKFFVCSPDLSYAAICESKRHIFIYCQNKSIASGQLRNRTTGQRVNTLAQQQVINLPSNEEILGVFASNYHLYVLGESFITAFKL